MPCSPCSIRRSIRSIRRQSIRVWAENLGRKDDGMFRPTRPGRRRGAYGMSKWDAGGSRMSFRRRHGAIVVIAAAALGLGALAARAAEPWLGNWKITESKVAPWSGKSRVRSEVDLKELMGKTVTFRPREIVGPSMLACK